MEIKEMKKVITIPTDLDTIDYRIIEPDNNGPLVKTVCIVGNNFKERVTSVINKSLTFAKRFGDDVIVQSNESNFIFWFRDKIEAETIGYMAVPYETAEEFVDALEKYYYN